MADIVERLLAQANGAYMTNSASPATQDQLEAANTITTLRAEVEMWKEAARNADAPSEALRAEVERLSDANDQVWADNERLRAALKKIEYLDRPQVRGLPRRVSIQEIAAAALAQEKQDE